MHHNHGINESAIVTCDRCGKDISQETDVFEWQERFAIRFRGGYGSVFGDGAIVEADFCQGCIRESLGQYLRVGEGDPSEPRSATHGRAEKIRQPDDLDQASGGQS